ncbi:MAG TPA: glycosyltransferase family 4 protein [Gemmatimonadales bacterium]
MRVLLLNYEFPPFGGGAGIATRALACGLAARGMTVDVVTAGTCDETHSELLWNGSAESEGLLTVHRVVSRRIGVHEAGVRGAITYMVDALPVVRRLLREERYDVAHFMFSLPTGAMLPFLNLRGTPVVVSLRGSDVPGYDAGRRSLERAHLALRPLTRWIWRRADRVIAVSDSLGRLARRTLPDLRYAVIPNGVDLARFRPRLRPARPHQRLRCLAVARLVERKGLANLIRAVALQGPGRVELEIVGTGPEERPLRALAAELGVSHLVTFAGALEHAAVAQRYREADLFTLACSDEAFGTAFGEAMASGLPIVGTAVGAIPELVRDGRNGLLVPSGDVQALACAIRALADDPGRRAQMARRNRADVEEHLSWERVTARHLVIYNGMQRRVPARPLLAEHPTSTW